MVSFAVDAIAYDRFMGRYSVRLAPSFADFAGLAPGNRVLDVGCGPGALTTELVHRLGAAAVAAVDPSEQLLAGPAYAAPVALDRAEHKLENMDLVDLHEAFAAQVLSNTQAFESDAFAQEKLGRDKKLGVLDWERVNVLGGSIALGHPFAATGARQIMHTLRELRRRGGEFALCTACAAGGLAAAMVLEAA